jgi:hypothetical protein
MIAQKFEVTLGCGPDSLYRVWLTVALRPHSPSDPRTVLSVSASAGGRASGQMRESVPDYVERWVPGWSRERFERDVLPVWERWHLNSTRAGCAHQEQARRDGRPEWDTRRNLELVSLKPGERLHAMRNVAQWGDLSVAAYAKYAAHAADARPLWLGHQCPKHPALWGEIGARLLTDGWLAVEKRESKQAGWVHPSEHPDGLLCKPCEVCGYKYGSEWIFEELPAGVVETVLAWARTEGAS